MSVNWNGVIWVLAWPPVYTFILVTGWRMLRSGCSWRACVSPWLENWLFGCGGCAVGGLIPPLDPPEMGIAAVMALGGYLVWLWQRRRRDRARNLIGEKSRALVAALVRRARESAQPRPVLRPQPGGAS